MKPLTADEAVASVELRVQQAARRFVHPCVEYDDLCQEGRLGTFVAWTKFDAGRDCAFITYADHYIWSYIRRCYYASASPISLPCNRRLAGAKLIAVSSLSVSEERDREAVDIIASGFEKTVIDRIWLQSAIQQLPPTWRQVILLMYWQDLRAVEIARLMRRSEGRIGQLHRAALQRLRRLLTAKTGGMKRKKRGS